MSDYLDDMPRGEKRAESNSGWERSVLHDMAMSMVTERRRARRWSIFFRFLLIAYIAVMTAVWLGFWKPGATGEGGIAADAEGPHTALVRIDGVIKAGGENSAKQVNTSLRAAFKHPNTVGVILQINSPGGSPVQSALIFDEIRRLREKYPDIELHAVVEEVCASGGYYVAAAADKIHVSPASLVGSIGVLMDGFGFVEAMHKLGVERRLVAAGSSKGFMDSFSPVVERDRDHLQGLLDQIHQQFIGAVKDGRGDRLSDDPGLFTGLVWTGAQSIELGLADAVGSPSSVARDLFEADRVVNFSDRESLIERIARRLGVSFAGAFSAGVREGMSGVSWR